MIKIFTNTVTRKNYNENGDLFRDGLPNIFMNGTDTVAWQLCTATPDIARETGGTPEELWTKDTQYSEFNAIGAFLTADNDYVKRMPGVLTVAASAGSVSTITARIPDAGLNTVPLEGTVTLFDNAGGMETVEYDSVEITDDTCVFTLASGTTLTGSYAIGSMMDCIQSVLMQASLDTDNSDPDNGLFVFTITANSRKLHDLMAYANTKEAEVMGLELAIFDVDSENETVVDLDRYELDTFAIRSGIADTSTDAQVTPQRQSQAVTVMKALLSAGFDLQFSADGNSDWHSPQSTTSPFDMYFRFRSAGAGGDWSGPIMLPESTMAKIWAEGTDEEVEGQGGTHSAKAWAQIALNGVTRDLVTSSDATLSPSDGNAYVWTPSGNGVIEFNHGDLSGKYVEVPIYVVPASGSTISGSTTSGKEVTLEQEVSGEGWYMLMWNGSTAKVYSYMGLPSVDGNSTVIQQKRKTASEWTTANPTLAAGEIGIETDTGNAKIGDGTTAWNSLPYSASPGFEEVQKTLVEVTSSTASLQAGKRYHVTVADNGTCAVSFDATTLTKEDSQAEIAVYIERGEGATVTAGTGTTIVDEVVESGWYRLVATNDGGTVTAKLYSSSAGGDEVVIEIPSATAAYSLADNSRYTHKPQTQPTYTLPEITNGKIVHKIVIDIDFTHTQYAEFVSSGGTPIALGSVSPSEGEVYRMTCRYIAGNWRIGAEKILSVNTVVSNTGEIEIEDAVAGKAKSLAMTAPQSVVMNQHAKATDVTTNTSSNGVVEVSDAVAGDALALNMTASRSVVANQLIPKASSSSWLVAGGTLEDSGNSLIYRMTVNRNYYGGNQFHINNRIDGHVYIYKLIVHGTCTFDLQTRSKDGVSICTKTSLAANTNHTFFDKISSNNSFWVCFMSSSYVIGTDYITCTIQLVDLTQYFNGDQTLIDSITSWDDLVAYDPRFASYVEYNTGTVEGVTPTVKVSGKNLLNTDREQGDTTGWQNNPSQKRNFDFTKYYVGLQLNNNGFAPNYVSNVSVGEGTCSVTSTSYGVSFPYPVRPNQHYRVSFSCESASWNAYVTAYGEDGTFLKALEPISTNNGKSATFVTPAGCYAICVNFGGGNNELRAYSNIQLELGSTATAYEPYHAGGTAQASELFAVGNAADEYEAVAGVTTRKMASVDLGTLNWRYGNNRFYTDCPSNLQPPKNTTSYNFICSSYRSISSSQSLDSNQDAIAVVGTRFYTYAVNSSSPTPTGLLYYELATPTTSASTPTQISLQAGNNVAMQTDGGRTLAELAITCEAGLYNRAIDPTHVYIHYNGVASEIVAGESSIVINGNTDELVDLTQYFGGDSALIANIANWGDLVAYDPTFASAVAYNKGTVAGITPSIKVNDGSAITSPSELFRINTAKNTYDAINGNIVEEAGRVNLATLAWTESSGSYSATISDIKASTSNILLPNGYTGSVSGTTLTITASESPTGYMVYEKATPTTTDVTPVEVTLQQNENSIVQVDGGRKADPIKVTYECQPSSFDVVTKEDLVPAYVYGIDHDTAIDDETTACKWVLLNHAYDNKDYPSELRYNYVQALGVLPCHDIRRCVMDDLQNRHVNYYLHPDNSNYKADGITPSILTGADGDVMAHVRKAQYRKDVYTDSNGHVHNVYLISEKKFNGSKWHTAFRVSKGGASARDQFVGAFRDVLCDAQGNVRDQGTGASPVSYASGNRMRSIAGARPASNTSRANFRAGSVANGANGNINTFMAQYIGLLMAIEGCSFNSQRTVSIGYSNLSAWNYQSMRKTGRTAVLGNHTGEIIADDLTSSGEDYDLLSMASNGGTLWNSTAQSDHSKRVVQCSYRGIEDPIGCMWQFEDGIQKYQNDIIISITVSSVKYTRDVADDVQLPLYCFKNGSTSCYAKSATPAVNDILYSNTTGTSKGTITAVDSENGTVTCGGVVYTRTSASDTNGNARAWLSMSDGTTKKYTWVANPTSGTVYSDTLLSTSGGSIGSIEADYSQSGFWCTTDTDKYTMLDTSRGYGAQNSKFPSKGYTGPNVVWVSHPWPKLGGYALKFDPDNFFPTALGGSATKGECNYYYNDAASGARVVYRLGYPKYGGSDGAWYVLANDSLGYANTSIGGRQTA